MAPISREEITEFIEDNIKSFHDRRLKSLSDLKLSKILKRKNPYLFRAKNLVVAADLVQSLVDAHLSSQEESLFGEFLEDLAIFICGRVYGGRKSAAEGIDLEFERNGIFYLVSIKSGPNWGNSRQVAKMREDFKRAQRIMRGRGQKMEIRAVNGCCYGKDNSPDKGDYFKLCGQRFWELISGDENLYIDIIEPLGHRAKERNEEFLEQYVKVINRFVKEFSDKYCSEDGRILWDKLLRFNSGKSEGDDPCPCGSGKKYKKCCGA